MAGAVGNTPAIAPVTRLFFGWLAWTQWLVLLLLCVVVIVLRNRLLAWISAALAVAAGVIAWTAHQTVIDFARHIDHSLGAGVARSGYLTVAAGVLAAGISREETARTRAFLDRVSAWRPGLPVAVLGLIIGLLAFGIATWFSPSNLNATFADTARTFGTTGLAGHRPGVPAVAGVGAVRSSRSWPPERVPTCARSC